MLAPFSAIILRSVHIISSVSERFRAVLDRAELIHALNRMNRNPVARLEAVSCSTKNKFKRPTPPSRGPSPPSSVSSSQCGGDGKTYRRHVIESTLLELCTELSVLASDIKTVAGPATVKLLDALAAYRDSELTTAYAASLRLTTLEVPVSSTGARHLDRSPRAAQPRALFGSIRSEDKLNRLHWPRAHKLSAVSTRPWPIAISARRCGRRWQSRPRSAGKVAARAA